MRVFPYSQSVMHSEIKPENDPDVRAPLGIAALTELEVEVVTELQERTDALAVGPVQFDLSEIDRSILSGQFAA